MDRGVKITKQLKPKTTPPKSNIAPEKSWLEDEFTFGIPYS